MKFLFLLLLSINSISAFSGQCEIQKIKTRRDEILKLMQSKEYDLASKVFLEFEDKCYLRTGDFEEVLLVESGSSMKEVKLDRKTVDLYYWLISDGLLSLQKAKKAAECIEIGIAHQNRYYHNPFIDMDVAKTKVGHAIAHTVKKCENDWNSSFQPQPADTCPLTLDDRRGPSVKIPKEFLGPSSETVCLQWVDDVDKNASQEEQEAEVPKATIFPHFRLISVVDGQSKYVVLKAQWPEDAATNLMNICGLDHLSLHRKGDKLLVKVKGSWSPCLNGTASGYLEQVFDFDQKLLTPLTGIHAGFH